jgi:hypothetical protein
MGDFLLAFCDNPDDNTTSGAGNLQPWIWPTVVVLFKEKERYFILKFLRRRKMNIKEQIKQAISSIDYFAFSSLNSVQIDKFRSFATKFLDARTFGESERRARQLINFVLYQHEKNTTVGQVLESMNNFELYEDYSYKAQRLHFSHQANVFLLGLYIYRNFSVLIHEIENEMVRTTFDQVLHFEGNTLRDKLPWRYSGGKPEGEFLYRWRLCSLSHDIGYGISLLKNEEDKIREHLDELSTFIHGSINSLSDLWTFNDTDLRNQLDSSIRELEIEKYMEYQSTNPFKNVIFYDHGLISALIFLRLMHEEYDRHKYNPVTFSNSSIIIWDPHILGTSILQAALAIALHNIDQHEKAFKKFSKKVQIFDINERPLAWLLKVSDILQEWDKPQANEDLMSQPIPPTNIQISFIDDKIEVRNFPKETQVKGILNAYTNTMGLFEFK